MAINCDSLPSNKPYSMPEPGFYYATIDTAEMKTPKDTSKPDYLNLKLKLKDKTGKNAGIIFDIIAESEHSLVQYKLKRFLIALGVNFSGTFELKDVQKVCAGKEIIVDVKIEKGQEGRQDRAVVDATSHEVYYPISEAELVFGEGVANIINASDAEDSTEDVEDEF